MLEQVNYRTTCKGCEFHDACYFEGRDKMVKRRCYLDALSLKMKLSLKTIIKKCNAFNDKFKLDFTMLRDEDEEWWCSLTNRQRMAVAKDWLQRFGTPSTPEIKLVVAVTNCRFNSWRDGLYIKCAGCGAIIENSKQRNRMYCENCSGYHPKPDHSKICIDCGNQFEAEHNREIRCQNCQIQHDKEMAREYARRSRAKRKVLEHKS